MRTATKNRPRIISGGQTGVDRGALDAALKREWPCGGTCPKGRVDELGRIPDVYPLEEASSRKWSVRTKANVRDADATLILVRRRPLSGGTGLTLRFAEELSKPVLVAAEPWDVDAVALWIESLDPDVLNVAGPRESGAPGIGRAAESFMTILLDRLASS